MQQKNLQQLFDKNMTRKEFLGHIGGGFLVLIGVKGLMNHFLGESSGSQNLGGGYGSSRYGG
jgi:uncharacterized protein (DUF927 family)